MTEYLAMLKKVVPADNKGEAWGKFIEKIAHGEIQKDDVFIEELENTFVKEKGE